MPKVLSLAWETILEIGHALEDKHCQPEDILELFRRLHNDVQNIHEELEVYINTLSWDHPTICYNDDDDEDCTISITPILSTEEWENSLSMGDENLDTISETKSDELIKSRVENLVPIPSYSKDQFEDFSDSNEDYTSIDDNSFSIDDFEYVEASPLDSELVSLEVMHIVIPKVGGIDADILLTIKDDILHEKLLNINLLIAKIKALKDNPTLSSDFMTKSSSTSFNFLLEETNTFYNSIPESETFCFDSKENSSGSTTTRSGYSLPDYEAFYDDHVNEISSGSTTIHFDFSLYDSFIFDLSINPFPSADMSDFYEFVDELANIISPPEYDCFSFKNESNSGDFTMDVMEDTFPTRESRVHNVLPTHPTLQLNLDFILSSESLFSYVFEGIPDNIYDVPFHDNSPPLDSSKDQFEDFSDSNEDYTLIDDNSFSIDDIEYVEASPPDSGLVSLEVMEIVIPKVGGIDADILLTIKDDILHEKLLNINLLIAKIKALKDNPTPSSDFMTKSSSTSFNFLLEETNTFDNSIPESETFCFDSKENSSGSTTTCSDYSLPDYEAFYDDHVNEISSGSTTIYFDFSLYDSFIFDLSINPFPSADRSDFYEFVDELTHIISPSEYDCFSFKNESNLGDFTMDVVEDTFPTRESRVHNVLPTHPTLQLNLDFILSSESLFSYVVWIFLPFLTYLVAPQYLLSFGNEDTIFDPGISIYHSFMPDVSHRSGTFIKFNVYPKHLNGSPMDILFSTCSPMDQ
nr:hypothetical protein [Tanacetum cinerariifolium]